MHRSFRRILTPAHRSAWTLLPVTLMLGAGLPAETVIVEDIWPGASSSDPNGTAHLEGLLFFGADDGATGEEPWISDGTLAGTRRIKDIDPGPGSGNPVEMTTYNNRVFFEARTSNTGYELWRSDGTAAGTVLVKDINPGPSSGFTESSGFVESGGELFFAAVEPATGRELWKTTGSGASTVRVKDIRPGTPGSEICDLVEFKGKLYFGANDGTNGIEVWRSDGTGAGTKLLAETWPGLSSGLPDCDPDFVEAGGLLYFGAFGVNQGRELWVTDGTGAGTRLVKDINPGFGTSDAEFFIAFGDEILFAADDGVHGYELWRSDGTTEGTFMVKDLNPGPDDGMQRNSSRSNMNAANGEIFFNATDGVHGHELWKSDGTRGGTYMVRDITPGPGDSQPRGDELSSGTLYFRASSPFGTELYRTNGTEVGTVLVKDILPGEICSVPTWLTDVWGTLMFAADDGVLGEELWRTGEPVQPIDIERLPTVNNNKHPEAAVLVREFEQARGHNMVIVKDGKSGKTISNPEFFNPSWRAQDVVVIDRKKNSRVAVLATKANGDIAVQQRDAKDGKFRGTINYFNRQWRALQAATVTQVGATGIAVLAVKKDGTISAQIRAIGDGSLIRTATFLNASATAVRLAAVPDMNGNGRSEIVLLAFRGDGRPVLEIRDAVTGKRIRQIDVFGAAWRPLDLVVLESINGNASPDFAVLAENVNNGKIAVDVLDGNSGNRIRRTAFLSASWMPHQLRALPDASGNGAPELAVLAANEPGRIRVQVKDSKSGAVIDAQDYFSPAFAPVAMTVLENIDASAAAELALLAFRDEGGDIRVQERDGGNGAFLRNTPIP